MWSLRSNMALRNAQMDEQPKVAANWRMRRALVGVHGLQALQYWLAGTWSNMPGLNGSMAVHEGKI